MNEDPVGNGDGTGTGYDTNYNLPGDTQGETNALYAGVTTNNNGDDVGAYLEANPGTRTDILSQASSMLSGITGLVQQGQQATASVAQTQARNNWLSQHAYTPTLQESWNALSPFEKIGAIASLIAVVVFLKRA